MTRTTRLALGWNRSSPTRHAVHVLPEGGLEEKLKLGRPLRVKLGIDPTSPDVHVGFGGRRSTGCASGRTRATPSSSSSATTRRGSAIRQAARPSGRSSPTRSSTRTRSASPSRPSGVLDPRPHGGALQRRVAREAVLRRGRAADADDHGRAAARARRLREAVRRAGADLALRAPVPADAGLRLGRDRGRRRDRRHRPALQPPHRAAT